jgi:hypothetical protein
MSRQAHADNLHFLSPLSKKFPVLEGENAPRKSVVKKNREKGPLSAWREMGATILPLESRVHGSSASRELGPHLLSSGWAGSRSSGWEQ